VNSIRARRLGTPPTAADITIDVIGQMAVRVHGRQLSMAPAQQQVLRLLVTGHGFARSAAQLRQLIWPDDDGLMSVGALRARMRELRDQLGAVPRVGPGAVVEFFRTWQEGFYRLNIPHRNVDAFQLDELVAEGSRALRGRRLDEAADRYRAALVLCRNRRPDDGVRDGGLTGRIARQHRNAMVGYAEAMIRQQREADVIADLGEAADAWRSDERMWLLYVTALYREGCYDDAADACRAALAAIKEYGLDDSAMTGLQQQVLHRTLRPHLT
jgi:DNA-binding SARP family transcriptional activator